MRGLRRSRENPRIDAAIVLQGRVLLEARSERDCRKGAATGFAETYRDDEEGKALDAANHALRQRRAMATDLSETDSKSDSTLS
jgi:hypothetical protein